MSDQRFDIVFNGVVRPGFDPAQARGNLAALFKTTPERIAALFSGREVVLKSGVDEAHAEKYRGALQKAGVLCRLRPVAGSAETPPAARAELGPASAGPATAARGADGNAPGLTLGPDDGNLTTPDDSAPPPVPDTSHLSTAELGANVLDAVAVPPPPAPDTSHLSTAELGAYVIDADDTPPPPPPDTSHLSTAQPGGNVLEPDTTPPPPPPDTSHLSTAESGADLGVADAAPPPPPPDTSHLSLASDNEDKP